MTADQRLSARLQRLQVLRRAGALDARRRRRRERLARVCHRPVGVLPRRRGVSRSSSVGRAGVKKRGGSTQAGHRHGGGDAHLPYPRERLRDRAYEVAQVVQVDRLDRAVVIGFPLAPRGDMHVNARAVRLLSRERRTRRGTRRGTLRWWRCGGGGAVRRRCGGGAAAVRGERLQRIGGHVLPVVEVRPSAT